MMEALRLVAGMNCGKNQDFQMLSARSSMNGQ